MSLSGSALFIKLFSVAIHLLQALGHGEFWFVSDFHVDQNYSRTGNPARLCHEDKIVFPDVGLYGNYLCDSPLTLLNATIEAMHYIQPNPDFIIWTGDNLPHTIDLDPDYEIVFEAINNITVMLSTTFPKALIFPCIGNHDTFPPNILPSNEFTHTIYDGYLEKGGWNKILSPKSSITFHQGGFYSELIRPGLRLISLNTILWYSPNNLTAKLEDPADQFKWLKETLKECLVLSEKVYIIGHVPPGYYTRIESDKPSLPTFHPQFLKTYLDVLRPFSEILIGQFYGHYHMDTFQLFNFDTGVFKSSSLIASSVTPWHYNDLKNFSLPVNPSIRLMHYSKLDFSLLDYDQFYMNLSKVNNMNGFQLSRSNLYEPLYKFTEFYGVPDLSTESLLKVYEKLKMNETVFRDFFRFLTAGKEVVSCENDCKVAQLCAMSEISAKKYVQCMKTVNETNKLVETMSYNLNTNVIVASVILMFILLILVLFIVYQRYWKLNCRESRFRTHYEPFLNY